MRLAEVRRQGDGGSSCASSRMLGKTPVEPGEDAASEHSGQHPSLEPQLLCPECGSSRLKKNGLRYLKDESSVQRWTCKNCNDGSRFSEKGPKRPSGPIKEKSDWSLKGENHIHDGRQVCVALARGTKNLGSATEIKTVVGEENSIDARITQYEWKCKKRGLQQNTIDLRKYHLNRLVKDGADLSIPDSVEAVLATKDYPTATKWLLVNAYRSYTKMFSIQWEPIRIKYQPKVTWLPTQEECLIFIGGLTKTLSIFCRVLYETGARRGEACKIEWSDIDTERHTIAINHPEKGSNPRVNRVSKECIELLNSMRRRKDSNYVFAPNPNAYGQSFYCQRRRIADINGKQLFLKIHFHTFRHVRGTLDTRNGVPLMEVKERLGHRYLANTEKYIHWKNEYYHTEDDKFYSTSASTDEEADKLIENGWKWECTNPNTGRMHFKKPRFE